MSCSQDAVAFVFAVTSSCVRGTICSCAETSIAVLCVRCRVSVHHLEEHVMKKEPCETVRNHVRNDTHGASMFMKRRFLLGLSVGPCCKACRKICE